MLQRKQTIYMLLAVAAIIVCLCLPIARMGGDLMQASSVCYNLGVYTSQGFIVRPVLFADLCVAATLTLITIFLYSRRKLQVKLCKASIALCVLWYAYYAYTVATASAQSAHPAFAACLPLIAIVLLVIAIKGIRYDEKLIRDSERIR